MKRHPLSILIIILLLIITHSACNKEPMLPTNKESYFPNIHDDNWDQTSVEDLNWDKNQLTNLYEYLSTHDTRAFIVLKDGKIVIEKYWGKNILNTGDFTQNSKWYWASAGKTITATLVGIAQHNQVLSINDKTSKYLGVGWTEMAQNREDKIKIKHQLTMTTGLDYNIENTFCTDPNCLSYQVDPGIQWYYHNASYTLLHDVISSATGMEYNKYTDLVLEEKIGMNGKWNKIGFNNTYWSTARDAARYGLLMLNKGKWKDILVLEDSLYYNDMTQSSQSLNPSYGYLWWLNGKSKTILPLSPISYNRSISPSAPVDLISGMGKDGQFVEFIPSKNIVVIRFGKDTNDLLVPIKLHDDMWKILSEVIQ